LVTTPLTERAFFALTHALALRLGGAPGGPAGTGKTETVKALGAALGRMVCVFNCDESFDARAMGRILEGLCRAGAWGCFDEFNRLAERTLSAISAAVLTIQDALAGGAPGVALPGARAAAPTPLSPHVALFVTMNPGYAGRSELPDNLKALFRPVAMMAPDAAMIASVTLAVMGFAACGPLSRAVTGLFASAAGGLSRAPHYDWGLRAMKTVLAVAGAGERGGGEGGEAAALAAAVLTTVLPKLLPEDLAPFKALFAAAFPSLPARAAGAAQERLVAAAVAAVAERAGLQWGGACGGGGGGGGGPLAAAPEEVGGGAAAAAPTAPPAVPAGLRATPAGEAAAAAFAPPPPGAVGGAWFEKVLQLSATLAARHGVMLVGPPGSGKSAAWRTLLAALELLDGVRGECHVVDAKALVPTRGTCAGEQLYGRLDGGSLEWRDGWLSELLRCVGEGARGEGSRRVWIVFDGEVDPSWAESLNSVLDDTRALTLPSGERMPLPPNVRLLFELDATRSATLATISRTGMVCFAGDTVPPRAHFACFLAALAAGALPGGGGAGAGEEDAPYLRAAGGELEPLLRAGGLAERALSWVAAGVLPAGAGAAAPAAPAAPVMPLPECAHVGSLLALLREALRLLLTGGRRAPPARAAQAALHALAWLPAAPFPPAFQAAFAAAVAAAPEARGVALPEGVGGGGGGGGRALTLMDFKLDVAAPRGAPEWTSWESTLPPPTALAPAAIDDAGLVIPTVDSARTQGALSALLAAARPVVLCGPPGSGKTMLLAAALAEAAAAGGGGGGALPPLWLSFSAATSPATLLAALEARCEYRVECGDRWVLAPRGGAAGGGGAWLPVFCDELNLPAADSFGCQRALALLRQFVEAGGFWAPKNLRGGGSGGSGRPAGGARAWVALRGVRFLGACNPPGDAGRSPLPPRLLRHAAVLHVGYSSPPVLARIYGCLFGALASLAPRVLPPLTGALAAASLDVWEGVSSRFAPLAGALPQCVYSPRDLSRWVRALKAAYAAMPPSTLTAAVALQLWAHEGARLFADRLPDVRARAWVDATLAAAAARHVRGDAAPAAATLPCATLFTTLGGGGELAGVALPALTARLGALAPTFRAAAPPALLPRGSPLVVTGEFAAAAAALVRVLRQRLGHAVLAGASGAGKTLLAHFSAWLCGLPVETLSLAGGGGGGGDPDAALRGVLLRAGVGGVGGGGGSPRVLLFDDDEANGAGGTATLEKLNSLLTCGEVPGLWEGEEGAALLAALRAGAPPSAHPPPSDAALLSSFADAVRANVHVVYCLAPAGGAPGARRHANASPALYNRCVTLWLGEWGLSARAELAVAFAAGPCALGEWDVDEECEEEEEEEEEEGGGGEEEGAGGGRGGVGRRSRAACAAALAAWTPPVALRSGGAADAAAALSAARAAREAAATPQRGAPRAPAAPTYTDAVIAALLLLHSTAGSAVEGCAPGSPAPASAAAPAAAAPPLTPHASPRHFLDLLRHFSIVFAEERAALRLRLARTARGVARLGAAAARAAALRASLAASSRALEGKSAAAAAALDALVREQGEAERQTRLSQALAAELAAKGAAASAREAAVAAALAEAEPQLASARAAVSAIAKAHLDELRSLTAPPAPVRACLEAVLLLLGALPEGGGGGGGGGGSEPGTGAPWPDVRRVIKGGDFIGTVVGLDSGKLSASARGAVAGPRFLGHPHFTHERVQSASRACGPLFQWVASHIGYAAILERVAPLRAEAARLAAERAAVAEEAAAVGARLDHLRASADALKAAYGARVGEAEALKGEMGAVAGRASAAEALLGGLTSERERWARTTATAPSEVTALAPRAALAGAFLTYAGRCGDGAREALLAVWRAALAALGLPLPPPAPGGSGGGGHPLDTLAPPALRLAWRDAGLPRGDGPLGAALCAARALRPPLLLDSSPGREILAFLARLGVGGGEGGAGAPRASLGGGRASLGGGAPRARASLSGRKSLGGKPLPPPPPPPPPPPLPAASLLEPIAKPLLAAARFGTPLLLNNAEALGVGGGGGGGLPLGALCGALDASAALAGVRYGALWGGGRCEGEREGAGEAPIHLRLGAEGGGVEAGAAFRLLLHAAESPSALLPALPPPLLARLTPLSAGVEADSLREALLERALASLAPATAATAESLLGATAHVVARLAALEDELLGALAGVGGGGGADILENTHLRATLEATKSEAAELEREAERARCVLADVAALRRALAPAAAAGVAAAEAVAALPAAARCSLYVWSPTALLAGFSAGLRAHAVAAPPLPLGARPRAAEVFALTARVLSGVAGAVTRGMYERHAGALLLRLACVLAATGEGADGAASPEALALADAAGAAALWGGGGGGGGAGGGGGGDGVDGPSPRLPTQLLAALPPSAAAALSRVAGLSPHPAAPTASARPWQRALAQSLSARAGEWFLWIRRGGGGVVGGGRSGGAADAGMPSGWEGGEGVAAEPALAALRRAAIVALTRPDLLLPSLSGGVCGAVFPPVPLGGAPAPPLFPPDGGAHAAAVTAGEADAPRGEPLLLLCTPGADAEAVVARAMRSAGSGELLRVSLGAPEGRAEAEAALRAAEGSGPAWLLLRNTHLEDSAWLLWVAKSCAGGGGGPRLIFTAEVPALVLPGAGGGGGGGGGGAPPPAPPLPPPLLLRAVKLLLETPSGLRVTFSRALARLPPPPAPPAPLPHLLPLAAWLHALLLERRRFVPAGWGKAYAWGDADVDGAAASVRLLGPGGCGAALKRIVCEALHGARVETAADAATLARVAAAVLEGGERGGATLSLEALLPPPSAGAGAAPAPSIRGPPAGATAEQWARWAAELPHALPPAALGLPPNTDTAAAVRGAADALRVCAELGGLVQRNV
jgi:hypothetical protein